MSKFNNELILQKVMKPSEAKIDDITTRRFFLFVDGKKSVEEIKTRSMISDEDADKVISTLLEMGCVGPVGDSTISAGQENVDKRPKPLKSEIVELSNRVRPVLKKFIGPLADIIIEKELQSSSEKKDFFDKLSKFSDYIADEQDKNSYKHEIHKFMEDLNG